MSKSGKDIRLFSFTLMQGKVLLERTEWMPKTQGNFVKRSSRVKEEGKELGQIVADLLDAWVLEHLQLTENELSITTIKKALTNTTKKFTNDKQLNRKTNWLMMQKKYDILHQILVSRKLKKQDQTPLLNLHGQIATEKCKQPWVWVLLSP